MMIIVEDHHRRVTLAIGDPHQYSACMFVAPSHSFTICLDTKFTSTSTGRIK